MGVYLLDPIDSNDLAWRGSSEKGPLWVSALTPGKARILVAQKTQEYAKASRSGLCRRDSIPVGNPPQRRFYGDRCICGAARVWGGDLCRFAIEFGGLAVPGKGSAPSVATVDRPLFGFAMLFTV
jgi:hypothetical protein